jgi:hypothetical protein
MHHTFLSLLVPSALYAVALGVTAPAQAETRFPPAHLDAAAHFSSTPDAARPVPPPAWYLVAQPRPQGGQAGPTSAQPSRAASVLAMSWYRVSR